MTRTMFTNIRSRTLFTNTTRTRTRTPFTNTVHNLFSLFISGGPSFSKKTNRPLGLMDQGSASGAGDCGFESHWGCFIILPALLCSALLCCALLCCALLCCALLCPAGPRFRLSPPLAPLSLPSSPGPAFASALPWPRFRFRPPSSPGPAFA